MPCGSLNYTLIGLAEWDDKGNLVPELAEVIPSAENGGISPDGLTITWKLKGFEVVGWSTAHVERCKVYWGRSWTPRINP